MKYTMESKAVWNLEASIKSDGLCYLHVECPLTTRINRVTINNVEASSETIGLPREQLKRGICTYLYMCKLAEPTPNMVLVVITLPDSKELEFMLS